MKRLTGKADGYFVEDTIKPNPGKFDVLVETYSSYVSPGTESATIRSEQASISRKVLKFRNKILESLKKKDFKTLYEKYRIQRSLKTVTGYSTFGRVIDKGPLVSRVKVGDYVVAIGDSANHSAINVVPQGLCFPCDYNLNYSCVALLSIVLNAFESVAIKPFSSIGVYGAGLLGQFITQICSKSGHTVTCFDLDSSKKFISLKNGACAFFQTNHMQSDLESHFDKIFIMAPKLSKKNWSQILKFIKIGGTIVMVGAADLNVARSDFYKKKLRFVCPQSYGDGRGEFRYELLGNWNNITNEGSVPIDSNVFKAIKLIREGIVNLEFTNDILVAQLKSGQSIELSDKGYLGKNFIWKEKKQRIEKKFITRKNIGGRVKNNLIWNLSKIDVLGNSDYFKNSHKNSFRKLRLPVNKIISRRPTEKSSVRSISNTLLISTPNGEHHNDILKYSKQYAMVLVDKPIVTNPKNYFDLLQTRKNIYALMNRRYSIFSSEVQNFIENSCLSDLYFQCKFYVSKKNFEDRVYFEGGRIISEMVHHIDLAVFLLGEVNEIECLSFDQEKLGDRRENIELFLKHKNKAVSHLTYANRKDSFFKKEFVSISNTDNCLSIIDFETAFFNSKRLNKLSERDKGNKRMWQHLLELSKSPLLSNLLNDLRRNDILTYQVLSEIL